MATVSETGFGSIVNVASVPQRSPFRYPGGKTWLVPLIRLWLRSLPPLEELVEPFAGGAIVGLTAAFEHLAEHVTLVELDPNVAAVWQVLLNGHGNDLAEKIIAFDMNLENARRILAEEPRSDLERAFLTIVRNRVQRGGILAPGASLMKAGENGHGVKSRWYARTLQRRMLDIVALRDRLSFVHGDCIALLRQLANQSRAAYFIDPPYTVAGKRLYTHSMIDHEELFRVATALTGDFLMTYDDAEEVRSLASRHDLDTILVPMKSTHHERKNELLIGRNLDWARRSRQLQLEV